VLSFNDFSLDLEIRNGDLFQWSSYATAPLAFMLAFANACRSYVVDWLSIEKYGRLISDHVLTYFIPFFHKSFT